MGYSPTAETFHDDISAVEDELLNRRHCLGAPGEPSYEGSDIGKDHLYQE